MTKTFFIELEDHQIKGVLASLKTARATSVFTQETLKNGGHLEPEYEQKLELTREILNRLETEIEKGLP